MRDGVPSLTRSQDQRPPIDIVGAGAAPPVAVPKAGRLIALRSEVLSSVAIIVVILGIWYAAALGVRVSGELSAAPKLPYPHDVLWRMIDAAPTLIEATWLTTSRAFVGFFIGLAVGVLFAVVMIQSRWIEASFVPYVLASQMVPVIALVPILRAVLRDGDLVRLYVAAYVSFFVVTMAVLRGLKNASPVAVELMQSFNASRVAMLRYLRFPAAVPYVFTGLRIAAPLSLIGAIIVDFLGARNGLGYILVASLTLGSAQATMLWAALIISMTVGLVFTRIVAVIEARISHWQPAYRGRGL